MPRSPESIEGEPGPNSDLLEREFGELAERLNAAVSKTVRSQGLGGSNPPLSDFFSINGKEIGCRINVIRRRTNKNDPRTTGEDHASMEFPSRMS